jgi:polysaccharide biosynthesis protein PelB
MKPGRVVTKKRLESTPPPLVLLAAVAGLLLVVFPNAAAKAGSPEMSVKPVDLVESARLQAEVLTRAEKYREALDVLVVVSTLVAPDDTEYWGLFGELTWDLGLKFEAMLAYRTAWEGGSFKARTLERLIELYNASGEARHAVAVGQQAYRRLGEARWLLLAMDAASRASLWDELRNLSSQAQSEEAKFTSSEMYWLLEAHSAVHDGRKPRARAAYGQALALNSASVPTRVQTLWFEIDGGDKQQLGEHLANWQTDAQADPSYWAAYAVAQLQLNKVDESLVWFAKQVREKPDDFLWQLSYVSALSNAGRPDEVQRLRRSIALGLKDKLTVVDKLPKADGKVILLAYASMVRDFDGAAAGDQVLQDTLERGYKDADVYAQLVASSLSQNNVDSAHRWLLRAEADHQQLPAFQSLAVALARNDQQAIEQTLLQREKDLSSADRVTALRRLGRNTLALSLTEKSLLEAEDNTTDLLRQHRDQLKLLLSRRVEVGYERRNLSGLRIERSEVAASLPLEKGRATLRVARNELRSDSTSLVLSGFENENDISLLSELSVGDDPMRFTIGSNQRADKALTYGRFEWTHPLTPRLSARLDVSLNGLTEETSALRAIGSKDKVAVGLGGNLTVLTYARVELADQHFRTRNGDALGRGYRVEGEIGTTLFKGSPTWQVRVSGSSEKNQLEDRLPANLLGSVLPPSQTVEGVLSRRFSTLGLGSTLKFGQPDGTGSRLHGQIDGWVGRQWPANDIAYSLRAALSLPVSKAGQIRLETFYTNVQGGQSTQANRGVGILYQHAF